MMLAFCLVTVSLRASLASAGGLRGQAAVSTEDVEKSLFAELAGSLRSNSAHDHISELELALRPMYQAVPREANDRLGHAVVRYVLHRFFVHRRGWFIRGLEPGTGPPNASVQPGSEGLLDNQEWVPSYLQSFLEQLQGGKGISLRELAIIAATLEDLIHKEAVSRLRMAYNVLHIPLNQALDEAKARQVLEIFLMIYMVGGNFKISGPAQVLKAHDMFVKKVKDWGTLQEWMHKMQLELFPQSATGTLSFTDTARIVEEVGKRYANYNDKECGNLKSELLDIESKKAGRVRLSEFYKKGLSGVFEFNEKIEYLRVLGAMDEIEPTQPYVIVPNYVGSRPNCLVASSFYAICCRNECEDLMGALEKHIEGEYAKPGQILDITSTLSSSTVVAPRKLSSFTVQRLHSIAQKNSGLVPLHGRLFAQWMHHAFPRECPYPHVGLTNPQTPDEWMQVTGHSDTKVSQEEAMEHISKDTLKEPVGSEARNHHHFEQNELPWDESEELLLTGRAIDQKGTPTPRRGICICLLGSFASALVVLMVKRSLGKTKSCKSPLPLREFAQKKD